MFLLRKAENCKTSWLVLQATTAHVIIRLEGSERHEEAACIAGCATTPNLEGKWVTSYEETLCGTVLVIEDDRFSLTQAGRTCTGQWVYDVGCIKLYEDVEQPAQSGSVWFADYDKATDTLTLGNMTLYRE